MLRKCTLLNRWPWFNEYRDAKSIQLEDTEKTDENERLDVILYDDMITNVLAGEVVEVSGEDQIENKKGSKRIKRSLFYTPSISNI